MEITERGGDVISNLLCDWSSYVFLCSQVECKSSIGPDSACSGGGLGAAAATSCHRVHTLCGRLSCRASDPVCSVVSLSEGFSVNNYNQCCPLPCFWE